MKWQTRTLAVFIAATVPVDKPGATNQLVEQAQQIGIELSEEEQAAEAANRQPMNEPKVGSYEAFMSSFGAPGRWAGR